MNGGLKKKLWSTPGVVGMAEAGFMTAPFLISQHLVVFFIGKRSPLHE
jgi:hypothetical protein